MGDKNPHQFVLRQNLLLLQFDLFQQQPVFARGLGNGEFKLNPPGSGKDHGCKHAGTFQPRYPEVKPQAGARVHAKAGQIQKAAMGFQTAHTVHQADKQRAVLDIACDVGQKGFSHANSAGNQAIFVKQADAKSSRGGQRIKNAGVGARHQFPGMR